MDTIAITGITTSVEIAPVAAVMLAPIAKLACFARGDVA